MQKKSELNGDLFGVFVLECDCMSTSHKNPFSLGKKVSLFYLCLLAIEKFSLKATIFTLKKNKNGQHFVSQVFRAPDFSGTC